MRFNFPSSLKQDSYDRNGSRFLTNNDALDITKLQRLWNSSAMYVALPVLILRTRHKKSLHFL
jgi:hypothetical protein